MIVNKETADKIWVHCFGEVNSAVDPFGEYVIRDEHGSDEPGGWTVDHVWPQSSSDGTEGSNTYSNTQVLSNYSNQEKSNKLQGKINNTVFAVVKWDDNEGKVIGRMKVREADEEDWYWAYREW